MFVLMAPSSTVPSTHPWAAGWIRRLGTIGKIESFDFPKSLKRRGKFQSTVNLDDLVGYHGQVAIHHRKLGKSPLVLAGKSLGALTSCYVAAAHPDLFSAVVCLGYPLRAIDDTSVVRDDVLRRLRTRAMFCIGEYDKLCRPDELDALLVAEHKVHVVAKADHALMLLRDVSPENQAASDDRVAAEIGEFLR